MARLSCSRDGWGAVDDPETGELIQLDSTVPADVATRLAKHYPPIEVDEPPDSGAEPQGSDGFHCGVNDCSRSVDSQDATCWQH